MFPSSVSNALLKTRPFSVENEATPVGSGRVVRVPLAASLDAIRAPKLRREWLGEMGDEIVSIDQDEADRRRAPRASCRLHCRVLAGKERTRARIVDVSDGGLCLLSPTWFASKSKVHISIDVPNRGESIVEAQVWHVRRQKMHGGTRKVWAIGVMLEETDESYERLLLAAGIAPEKAEAPEPGRPTTNAASGAPSKAAAAPQTDSPVFQRRTKAETESIATPASPRVSDTTSQPRTPTATKSVPVPEASAATGSAVAPEDMIEPKIFRIRIKATAGPRTKVLTLAAESEEEARTLAIRDLEARWTIMEVRAA